MAQDIPYHEFYGVRFKYSVIKSLHTDYVQYYGPDFRLAVRPSTAENNNSKQYLDKITTQILKNLREVTFAPSVQISDVPRQSLATSNDEDAEMMDLDEDEHRDVRSTQYRRDIMVTHADGYVSDGEDEGDELSPATPRKLYSNCPIGPKKLNRDGVVDEPRPAMKEPRKEGQSVTSYLAGLGTRI
jgi:histone deacetylase 1/2